MFCSKNANTQFWSIFSFTAKKQSFQMLISHFEIRYLNFECKARQGDPVRFLPTWIILQIQQFIRVVNSWYIIQSNFLKFSNKTLKQTPGTRTDSHCYEITRHTLTIYTLLSSFSSLNNSDMVIQGNFHLLTISSILFLDKRSHFLWVSQSPLRASNSGILS